MQRRRITAPVMSIIVLCIGISALPAGAFLTINLNYIPGGEPSYDPAGTNLIAMMNAAAEHWGRATGIIQDNHLISINISWANLSDPNGTLGLHTNLDGGPVVKPTLAQIQMDTQLNGVNRNWYFDATPNNHSEYGPVQTRYSNLIPANQTAWYNGSVPLVLEEGFAGVATATSPLAAQNGPDMYSVALHEMGHALGLTTNVAAIQVIDGDYDVNPAFVGGSIMGITDNGTFHLPHANTVMGPGINSGIRRLPSATDVFAAASASGWSDLYLKRRDYIGGVVFSDPTAWIGGKTPNFTSDAFVRSFGGGGITVAQSSMQFQNLSVFDAWNVTALQNNVLLDVDGTTTIDGTNTTAGTTKIVLQGNAGPGSLLDTKDLLLVAGGRLELDGQVPLAAVAVDQTFDIDPTSSLFGHGFVQMTNDVVTDVLNNRGLIEADGGDLHLAATNTVNPVFDLDGDDPLNVGNLKAVNGDLSVHGLHVDDFDGLLEVGSGHEATFNHQFEVGFDGVVRLDGSPTVPATINGADLILGGDVIVDKLGRIGKGPSDLATFDGSAASPGNLILSVPDSDDVLSLEGPAVFDGGQYLGDGTIKQAADLTVASFTPIQVGTYDWGNSQPAAPLTTLIDTDALLRISSPTTGTPDNEYRGIMRLENGELEVNTTAGWMLPPEEEVVGVPRMPAGTLILQDRKSGSDMPKVRGQHITLGGNIISLGGPGAIESDLTTEPTADIDVRTEAELLLEGFTTYNGGNIHGAGTLRQIGNASVVGNTTIATTKTDWDGNEDSPSNTIIQPGVLMQIVSDQIDDTPGADGYDGTVTVSDTAALVVFTDSGLWWLDGTMDLLGQPVAVPDAIVDGSAIVNFGTIQGNGWLQAQIINQGTVSPGASAGAIRFELEMNLGGSSVLDMEIGGIVPITQFDQISTGGSALLAGTLDLSIIGGYVPDLDHEFDIILSAGPVLGTFSSVLFPTMPDVAFCLSYGTNTITVTTGLIGDLDGDGFVGIADLNIVLGAWNSNVIAGVWGLGDTSGDGFIGIEDLNAVLGNWNAGTPPPADALARIPEPSTAAMGMLLIMLGGGRHRGYNVSTVAVGG
jgi:hypothetical protein